MRIIVTGSSSFIGAEVLRLCAERGIEVVGLDLATPAQAGCHQIDIGDPSVADLIPEGADAIIHLAALSRDPDCRNRAVECFDANVMGTLNLVQAAEQRKVKHFVFASSEWVYDFFPADREKLEDDPINPAALTSEYALSKLVSECNLRQKFAHGLCPTTVLRFGIVYGPRLGNWSAVENLLNDVATKDEIKVGARATARRFVNVTDIAGATLAALSVPGFEVINVQGSQLVSLGEVIDLSAELLKRTPTVIETNPAAPNIRRVSNEKAARLMNWTAQIALRDGLEAVAKRLGHLA